MRPCFFMGLFFSRYPLFGVFYKGRDYSHGQKADPQNL